MIETGILVEQQPPQGVLACGHAGLVINQLSPFAVMVSEGGERRVLEGVQREQTMLT